MRGSRGSPLTNRRVTAVAQPPLGGRHKKDLLTITEVSFVILNFEGGLALAAQRKQTTTGVKSADHALVNVTTKTKLILNAFSWFNI